MRTIHEHILDRHDSHFSWRHFLQDFRSDGWVPKPPRRIEDAISVIEFIGRYHIRRVQAPSRDGLLSDWISPNLFVSRFAAGSSFAYGLWNCGLSANVWIHRARRSTLVPWRDWKGDLVPSARRAFGKLIPIPIPPELASEAPLLTHLGLSTLMFAPSRVRHENFFTCPGKRFVRVAAPVQSRRHGQ